MNPLVNHNELTTIRIREIREHLRDFLSSELCIELNSRKLDEKVAAYLGFDCAYAMFAHGKRCDEHADINATPNVQELVRQALQSAHNALEGDENLSLSTVRFYAERSLQTIYDTDADRIEDSLNEIQPFISSYHSAQKESYIADHLFSETLIDILSKDAVRKSSALEAGEEAITLFDLKHEFSIHAFNRALLENEVRQLMDVITELAAHDLATNVSISPYPQPAELNNVIRYHSEHYLECLNRRISSLSQTTIPQLYAEKLKIQDQQTTEYFQSQASVSSC